MITREARAVWNGSIQEGGGTLHSQSLEHPYSFATRFGDQEGTNPEELIGSALAGCFAMALSLGLGEAGHDPESIDARATVSLDPDALAIKTIELEVEGRVPGLDPEGFRSAAEEAKANCPVSKALAGVDVVLKEATLV